MAKTFTQNYNLEKDDGAEFYDVGVQSRNSDKTELALTDVSRVLTAGGSGTSITLTAASITGYRNGLKLTFVATASNSGAATTINLNGLGAKNLYKPGTTTSPSLTAGKAYDVWYDGTSFFLKASAEGNAVVADVLAGKTFSNDADTGLVGTMVNNGSVGTISLGSEGQEYTIPQGYHNGLGKVKAVINNLIASVIKAGTTVGGIIGTFTADATAAGSDILSGKTGYVNGAKVTGTIPSKSAATITPGTANQTISAGQYLTGNQVISGDADLVSANIKAGVNIFGVVGALVGGLDLSKPFKSYSGVAISTQTLRKSITGSGWLLSIGTVSNGENINFRIDGVEKDAEINTGGSIDAVARYESSFQIYTESNFWHCAWIEDNGSGDINQGALKFDSYSNSSAVDLKVSVTGQGVLNSIIGIGGGAIKCRCVIDGVQTLSTGATVTTTLCLKKYNSSLAVYTNTSGVLINYSQA